MTRTKRAFDILVASTGLLLSAPLFAAVAVSIKMGDRGPVFFRQERVGRRGQFFRIWKFRTMVADAERRGSYLTVAGDSRITPIGRWLRKSKLDELPQLLNVLVGEMTFVGPRPEVPRYTKMYTPEQQRVLALVPGITDPASIKYYDESEILARSPDPEREYVEAIMPDKISLNLVYAQTATVLSDVRVMLNTVTRVLGG